MTGGVEPTPQSNSKNIVICSDGTGNAAGKGRGTNVWKLYMAVNCHDHEEHRDRPHQIAFYDDGVGTDGIRPLRLASGAFGLGLSRNIRQLYTFLVLHYQPGDRVFLFGFSRGAFTVRSLAGMICQCGLLQRDTYLGWNLKDRTRKVKEILNAYRSVDEDAGKRIREELGLRQIVLDFIGVWDTVDAVGMPFDELKVIDKIWPAVFGRRLWQFRDRNLSPSVKTARQALAIDDERWTFHPNVWHKRDGVEQVWFAGVHSNIGGGYPKEGLANIALYWMFLEAQKAGLRFVDDAVRLAHDQASAHAQLYDSRSGAAMYYRYKARDIKALCSSGGVKMHVTALDRLRWATDGYAPTNLPDKFEVIDPDASTKAGVKRRVAERQAAIDSSASRRACERDKTDTLGTKRVQLYYAFLALNSVVVVTLAAFLWELEPVMGLLAGVSGFLNPALSWANPVIRWIVNNAVALLAGTVGVVIPGVLEMPIRSFAMIPELSTVFLLFGGGMFARRQVLVRQMRELGERIWSGTFVEIGHTPAPPVPTTGVPNNEP